MTIKGVTFKIEYFMALVQKSKSKVNKIILKK